MNLPIRFATIPVVWSDDKQRRRIPLRTFFWVLFWVAVVVVGIETFIPRSI
ncbi:hypothetical protein TC41_1007 [Alicyclobacillus acidocaldarius subsp. acidocaldarius Tc-4-1]|uniref:Uncharacterized protein n=1 Tax=Alicyclobacillus acidocaldarius (strain Tc-4-1) TaxID=1048834 RepID=F8IFY9_ALIAT|nr:hypothetical protein TC41_1007 [Alicyclobacillus acidocaldarius subsp. acidocaldarius Tc-4-1]